MTGEEITSVLETHLTPAQAAAAVDPADEVLCLACAGSGKSRTLAFRMASLLVQGEPPESIVAFTFTEKAADSIKRRAAQALTAFDLDPVILSSMYVGTIHAFCQRVMGEIDATYRQYDVLDENRLKLYLISRYAQLGVHALKSRSKGYFDCIKRVASAWLTVQDEVIPLGRISALDAELGTVLTSLYDGMHHDRFVDFSSMIRDVVDRLQSGAEIRSSTISTLRHVLVDEYQDINPAQEALIVALHERSKSLFVVGDDDQAIYDWRGADVGNILTFTQRYPKSIQHTLSVNYRSTSPIVETADSVVKELLGPTRLSKTPTAATNPAPRDLRNLWFPSRAVEAEWVVSTIQSLVGTEYTEADGSTRGLAWSDFAILMRSTRSAEQNDRPRHAAFTDLLLELDIPYMLEAGGGVFDRQHVMAIRDAFEMLRQPVSTRDQAMALFARSIRPVFPAASFDEFARTIAEWSRRIHAPEGGARQRLFPQQLLHELLATFGIRRAPPNPDVMRDIGVFSRIMQDVESVYLSIDSRHRFTDMLNFLSNIAEDGYDLATQEIVRRPNAVNVMTVHKAKGLEFPVVFLVDVQQGRFPGRQRKYDGWVPFELIASALGRGAYQSTLSGEARLFYTALTRAERYLFVTGSALLPSGKRPATPSAFAARLRHDELGRDPTAEIARGHATSVKQRVSDDTLPTTFSEIKYYLNCPRSYDFRQNMGFSPPIPEMFGYGRAVHASIGKLHEEFPDRPPSRDAAEQIAGEMFHLKHVAASSDPVERPGPYERAKQKAQVIAGDYVDAHGDDFVRRRQVERTFEIAVEQAVISGSIDLLIREGLDGSVVEAEVVDFKAIEGGPEPITNPKLDWTTLALQVQLYARAARATLGADVQLGSVHLLKDGQRIEVPVHEKAVSSALRNIEWAVERIIDADFPMRPHPQKCEACDFFLICPRTRQELGTAETPPPIHTPPPAGLTMAPLFSQVVDAYV
jgi:DNA helicase-2/ATP-dependent DNA helicase PcrA